MQRKSKVRFRGQLLKKRFRSAHNFFRWLKAYKDFALKLRLMLLQHRRSAQQHCHVRIMAAGMHHTRML